MSSHADTTQLLLDAYGKLTAQEATALDSLLAENQQLRAEVLKWHAEYDGVIHRAAQLHEALEKIAQHDSSQWGRYAAEQLDARAAVVEA